MRESQKYERIKAALLLQPATTRRQRIDKDAQLAHLEAMIKKWEAIEAEQPIPTTV